MSKIKADIIEPLGTAITISGAAHFTSGNAVLGGLTASTISTTNISVDGTVSGNLAISGKATSSSTSTSDTSTTLTTKGYVDNRDGPKFVNEAGTSWFSPINILSGTPSAGVNTWATYSIAAGTIPSWARHVIVDVLIIQAGGGTNSCGPVGAIDVSFRPDSTYPSELYCAASRTNCVGGDAVHSQGAGQAIVPINTSTTSLQYKIDMTNTGNMTGVGVYIRIIGYLP